LRIEIASMPAEIEDIERRITQLEIEREALSRESKVSIVRKIGTKRFDARTVGIHRAPVGRFTREFWSTQSAMAGRKSGD
jgi:ATP-dependent Clp protease ATP-binding subunit ClpB